MSNQAESCTPRRILFIVDCYLPSEKSAAKLAYDLAHELQNQGQHVTVLTPSSEILQNAVQEDENGVSVIRFRVGKIKGANHILRALNEMSLSVLAWLRCRQFLLRNPQDTIIFYSPTIFFGPLVLYLKKKWSATTYLVLRDIFPDWAVETGILKKGAAYKVFKFFERLQYRAADAIGVETTASLRYFEGHAKFRNVEVLRNWTAVTSPPPASNKYRQELGLEGKVVFFYGGNIGIAQDMDNIMRLAKGMLQTQQAHFLLVGSGSQVPHLEALIESTGLTNVTILPSVDQHTYLEMLGEFDVGLISLDPRLKSSNYPGKLLGYLQCEKPILASLNAGNDLAQLLDEKAVGFASINGDDEQLLRNATSLLDAPLRRQMSGNCTGLLREVFAVEHIARQILARTAP